MSRMDWTKASNRDLVRERGGDRITPEDRAPRSRTKKAPGISNAQAKELARLQRAASRRYTGNGMSAVQADSAIARLRAGS